jgi:hypothetical protein
MLYKTIILLVLYECGTWSLTLREEHRLRVFENRALGRIFGPESEEVVGGCRRLHSEELHNLYTSQNIISMMKSRRVRLVGHAMCMGEINAYKILVEKHEGKRPCIRLKCRWEDNIRMDFREVGWEDVDWMHLAQDADQWQALVITVMNLQVPQKAGNFLTS